MPKSTDSTKVQADWIAAIGEPTRLAIVRILATGEKTVSELAKALNVEIVNVSHHLGVMRDAGLVTAVRDNRDGRFMRYTLQEVKASGAVLELVHDSGIKVTIPFS
jgi:ArsR family transcriptional regulator